MEMDDGTMNHTAARHRRLALTSILGLCLACASVLPAQTPASRPAAKSVAPIDLTGYWVAVISEDWRWRMITPAKGDYASIPLTPEGKRVADSWDPAKDEAAGEQCRSYGAPGLMRLPTRLHITWQDDNTLKVESDLGMQTRLLHFGDWKPVAGAPAWQGDSTARWELARPAGPPGEAPKFGSLTVVTKHLRPGYMRKNGVPYSANAVLTEYWDLTKERKGDQWLVTTVILDDPQYLQFPWVTPIQFKREPDGAKWDPTPCSATW